MLRPNAVRGKPGEAAVREQWHAMLRHFDTLLETGIRPHKPFIWALVAVRVQLRGGLRTVQQARSIAGVAFGSLSLTSQSPFFGRCE